MERFNLHRLTDFVDFVTKNDIQVLANRREARDLYTDSLQDDGEFTLAIDQADKLHAFLLLSENQVHASNETVGIYSFIKIVSKIRRSLATTRSGQSTPAAPSQNP